MAQPYNPSNWYWIVGESTTEVYSSARAEYVSLTDATYTAWLASRNHPTLIDTDANLQVVLYQSGVLGVAITSGSTPAINGSYLITPQSKLDIEGVIDNIELNGTFPGGASTFPWLDISDTPHVFPSVSVFKEFATAIAAFVAAIEEFIDTGSGSPPSNQITIA